LRYMSLSSWSRNKRFWIINKVAELNFY
jgi:hypothetical protein